MSKQICYFLHIKHPVLSCSPYPTVIYPQSSTTTTDRQVKVANPILAWGDLMDTDSSNDTKASSTMCRIEEKNYMLVNCRGVLSKLEISPDRLTMAQEINSSSDTFSLQVISWNFE